MHPKAWQLFKQHHYLSSACHPRCKAFCAFVEGRPAAFTAVVHHPHANGGFWREHRTVCLPDFQGVGIGNALSEFVASLFAATRKPYCSTTSHPAMIRHRSASPLWRLTRRPSTVGRNTGPIAHMNDTSSAFRLTAGFKWRGPARREEAIAFGVVPAAATAAPARATN